MTQHPARWKPGASSPFARPAFPFGTAPYRPPTVEAATGVHTFGTPAPPVGGGPVPQWVDTPPVSWPGQWRPTEAELARWGGRAVLYGKAIPDNPDSGTAEIDVLDATLPWPMGTDCVAVVESLGSAWATDVLFLVRAGIGRAGWTQVIRAQPSVADGVRQIFLRVPFRQINVRARYAVGAAAGEILACSFGFGLVGV